MAKVPDYAVLNGSETESLLMRLTYLKSHRVGLVRRWRAEYRDQALRPRRTDSADYSTNVGFALVNQKLADILASLPKFDHIGMNEEGKDKAKAFKLVWDYEWSKGGVEKELYRTIMDALIAGCGAAIQYPCYQERKVKLPTGKLDDSGNPVFKEETIVDWDGPRLEFVEWENFFIDASDLDKAGELLVIRHYLRKNWLNFRKPMLEANGIDPDSIPNGRRYLWSQQGGTVNWGQNDPKFIFNLQPTTADDNEWVSEIHRWSKAEDKFLIVANGIHINGSNSEAIPLPSLHKELPVAIYTDHWVEGDFTGRGEFDVTFESRRLKDAIRSASIDVVKAQMGFTAVSPDAELDEGELVAGINSVVRVDPEALKHYAPAINSQILQYMEGKSDEDIITETGTDFKLQLLSPSETASKTVSKVEAQKRRISLNLKLNAWTFFKRLAMLRASDIMLCYSEKSRTIQTKGYDYSDGVEKPVESGWGSLLTKPEMFKGKIDVVPDIDSMTLDTNEIQKAAWLQELQIIPSLLDSDTGKPVVNPKSLLIAGKNFLSTDLDKLLQERPQNKSPESMLAEAGVVEQPAQAPMMAAQTAPAPEMADPNYIPPAQRSGAKKAVNTPGSQPKILR